MTLRSAIIGVSGGQARPRLGRALPDEPRIADLERKFAAAYGVGLLKPPPDLDEIADRLRAALRSSVEEGAITRRDLRFSPQCIWGGSRPFADDTRLLAGLLKRIVAAGRRSLTRTLAAVYFRMFDPDRPGLDLVAQALRGLMTPQLGPLYDLHSRLQVFELTAGLDAVASACLEAGREPFGFLTQYGLGPQSIVDGFGAAVFSRGMRQIAGEIARSPNAALVRSAVAWVAGPGTQSYATANKSLANTLLLPFLQKDPPEELKTQILDALLERIGDPRTRSQNWTAMPEAAQIARRWLTRLALRQFLEIVDDVAYAEQWAYRRAFWMAFYDKGLIEEAWVAFGPNGLAQLPEAFGKNVVAGRLEASWKGVEAGHAVLLMRVAGYTICDWSHNGRCIIWPNGSGTAPKLYQSRYFSGELAPRTAPRGGMEQTHVSPSTYSWQRKVTDFLRRNAGVTVTDRDFQVRSR